MAGRNINDEIANPSLGDSLQVEADGLDVDTVHERGARLQNMPCLAHELMQTPAGLLRL